MNCSPGYTEYSEFSVSATCDIPVLWYTFLKAISLTTCGLILLIELIWVIIWRKEILRKETPTKVLIFWAIIQNLVMAARPGLSLILNQTSVQSVFLAFVTHISAALDAGIVVLFVYIESNIIHNGSLNQKVGVLTEYRGYILFCIGMVQGIIFLIGPILHYFIEWPLYYVFWTPVIIIDFTIILYMMIQGFVIRRKILNMVNDRFAKLARHILIVVLLCGGIGLSTGIVGFYAVFGTPIEWILVEACWIAASVFNMIFFLAFSRKRKKRSGPATVKVDAPSNDGRLSSIPTHSND